MTSLYVYGDEIPLYFRLRCYLTMETSITGSGLVKVKQKMAVFTLEILGLNPSKSLLQSLGLSSSQHFAIADW